MSSSCLATCRNGVCKANSCVCDHGYVGEYCQENMLNESRTRLYLAYQYWGITVYSIAFLIIFTQLLRAFRISAQNKTCTAIPKTLCLVGLSISTLTGVIYQLDPLGYRVLFGTQLWNFFLGQLILLCALLSNYPIWRTWFQLQAKFNRSRIVAIQSPLLLLVLALFCLGNAIIILLTALKLISLVHAHSIIYKLTAVMFVYAMTIPPYFGWRLIKQLDQNVSTNELKSMKVLVLGCSIIYLILFCNVLVQSVVLPRVVAFTRTKIILSFFYVTPLVALELMIAVTIGRYSNQGRISPQSPRSSPVRNGVKSPRSSPQTGNHLSNPTLQQSPQRPLNNRVIPTPTTLNPSSEPEPASPTIYPDGENDSQGLLLRSNRGHESGELSVIIHLPSHPQSSHSSFQEGQS